MKIKNIWVALYKIPLEVTLSDSTHGEMPSFELITVRIKDEDGLEGLGYTYSVGVGGRAIRSLVEDDLKPILMNEDSSRIEHLWQKMWWRLHFQAGEDMPHLPSRPWTLPFGTSPGKGQNSPGGGFSGETTRE